MERGMETHNHDEHHVYDGVETQERSEIEDHNNSWTVSRKSNLVPCRDSHREKHKYALYPKGSGLKK